MITQLFGTVDFTRLCSGCSDGISGEMQFFFSALLLHYQRTVQATTGRELCVCVYIVWDVA